MMNRRGFISSSLALGAGLTLPQSLWAQLGSLPSKLPDRSLYDSNEDAYWRELRKQFLILGYVKCHHLRFHPGR